MAMSNVHSAPPPVEASTRSQNPKAAILPSMERLTSSEAEFLRKDMHEAMEYGEKVWGEKKAV